MIKIYYLAAPCCTNPRCTRTMLAGFILSPSVSDKHFRVSRSFSLRCKSDSIDR